MITAYLLLLLGVILWKGYFALNRGIRSYQHDLTAYASFYEYQIGNGASHKQACRPFLLHALERALKPLLSQWRLFLILAILGVLVFLFF